MDASDTPARDMDAVYPSTTNNGRNGGKRRRTTEGSGDTEDMEVRDMEGMDGSGHAKRQRNELGQRGMTTRENAGDGSDRKGKGKRARSDADADINPAGSASGSHKARKGVGGVAHHIDS